MDSKKNIKANTILTDYAIGFCFERTIIIIISSIFKVVTYINF